MNYNDTQCEAYTQVEKVMAEKFSWLVTDIRKQYEAHVEAYPNGEVSPLQAIRGFLMQIQMARYAHLTDMNFLDGGMVDLYFHYLSAVTEITRLEQLAGFMDDLKNDIRINMRSTTPENGTRSAAQQDYLMALEKTLFTVELMEDNLNRLATVNES